MACARICAVNDRGVEREITSSVIPVNPPRRAVGRYPVVMLVRPVSQTRPLWLLIALGVSAALAPVGCRSADEAPAGSGIGGARSPSTESMAEGSAIVSARWPFWPTRMRLHPLTRRAADARTGAMMIELRLEFRDEFGDTTKAIGQVRCELHDGDPRAGLTTILNQWNSDLRDMELNRVHYDDLTQTYLFRLDAEAAPIPAQAHVRCYFLCVSGRRFDVSGPLR